MPQSRRPAGREMIDFSAPRGSPRLKLANSLSYDGVHIIRGALTPNEDGKIIGGSQLSIAIHVGDPIDLEWSEPGSDRLRVTRVEPGMAHINPGDNPFFQRWRGSPELLIVAFDQAMIDRVGTEIFGKVGAMLRPTVGSVDRNIRNALPAWTDELIRGGPGGRLFVEGLAKATIVHLFRQYSDGSPTPMPMRGGLGAARLHRVIDYIEAHLSDDLSVRELATIAGLSAHHFGLAFRQSTGHPPHRYVIMRRIERAKALLLTSQASVTQIAHATGFSSHGHFTAHFRRLVGTTPSRFRLNRL
ncbi:MAG TPA: AraC family transcriptional regulator [Rhizorhapis sp.]